MVKPSSVQTEASKAAALEEYEAEREAMRERMARQRAARLATEALRKKNDTGGEDQQNPQR